MCGILGRIHYSKNEKSSLNHDLIQNRGPDSVNKFSFDNIDLVHTRLAIVNKGNRSDQPIINKNKILICNGEILNFKQIKRLISYNYNTNSDCEAILAVYQKYGTLGFRLLKGFFSFVLLDLDKKKIYLVKDSIGKKPLFYYLGDNEFLFSSNLDAIINNSSDQFKIDKCQKKFFFENGFINPYKTIIDNILTCLPGEIIEFRYDKKRIMKKKIIHKDKYKMFNFNSNENIEKKLFRLIEISVRKRLQDISNPVLLFSGGIDSTFLAILSKKFNQNIRLVTVKNNFFRGELYYVKLFEKLTNYKVHKINVFDFYKIKIINKFIRNLDQPLSVPSYLFLCFFINIIKKNSKIVLTGDGADEVFYGYEKFKNIWDNSSNSNLDKSSFLNLKHNFSLNDYGKQIYDLGLGGHGYIKIDKSFSENQIECRAPFLDFDLVDFVRKIPVTYWKDSLENKSFLKKYLLNIGFSYEYIYRKKKGIIFPFKIFLLVNYFYILIFNLICRKKFGSKIKFFDINYLWKLYVYNKFLNKNNGKIVL